MRVIALDDIQENNLLYSNVTEVLSKGGLVCFPSPSGYKLAADLESPSAVIAMIQAKRRIKNAPALVLIPDRSWITQVAEQVSPEAELLIKAFWPGPVTLLFQANSELPSKVRKALTKAKGWLGVRMPADDVSRGVLESFGRPVLVSSANLSRKHGERSVAQVRKNFGRTVELMIDAGDLGEGPKSTLVDLTGDKPSVIRVGVVSEETILKILA